MKRTREEQLWDYVEGRLPAPERALIEVWLAADPGNRQRLEGIRKLSGSLGSMEAEMPSMRFTASLMEAWDQELAVRALPLTTRTDKRVVWAIAALLGITLAGFSGFLFSLLSSAGAALPDRQVRAASHALESIFSGAGPYFAGPVIILLLALGERYLHYRTYIRNTR